jgi:Mg2+ and Co2+ transporter CorA
MIQAVNLGDNAETTLTLPALQVLNLPNHWVELVDPTEKELQATAEKTGIPRHFLELPQLDGEVGLRIEPDFAAVTFVIQQDITISRQVHPILMVFNKSFLISVSKKEDQSVLDVVKQRMSKIKIDPPSHVAYFIMDEIVSRHFIQLERLETLTAGIEEEVVEKTTQATLNRIFRLKAELINFNKTLWYERGVIFNLKTCGETCMAAKAREMFNTTHEDLTRQIDIVETYREIMSDAINVHLSAVSNKINLSIKSLTVVIFYLTIVTTLTSFPNTIATFFGISQFGTTDIVIIAVALALSIFLPFVWLWRKKWLKYDEAALTKTE